jgi:hypothetical protein
MCSCDYNNLHRRIWEWVDVCIWYSS